MEKPDYKHKPTNVVATIGLALMSVFIGWVLYWEIGYYINLLHSGSNLIWRSYLEMPIEALLLVMSVYGFIVSLHTPLIFDDYRKFMIILATLFFVYYIYFVGIKVSMMSPHILFGKFASAMFGVIIPDVLLWHDIINDKTRVDDYFAYLYYLKKLDEYNHRHEHGSANL